ncbi:MAG: hypothetical protein FWH03_06255 [Firmicutes bacterium]|nr:hypothetical protein [Bacillota bacterium]
MAIFKKKKEKPKKKYTDFKEYMLGKIEFFKDYKYNYQELMAIPAYQGVVVEVTSFEKQNILIEFIHEIRDREVNLRISQEKVETVYISLGSCVDKEDQYDTREIKQAMNDLSKVRYKTRYANDLWDIDDQIDAYMEFLLKNKIIF